MTGFGLGTRVHAVPFQCRIRVLSLLDPTVQALLAEVAVTAERELLAGLGLRTRFQTVPFQCRTRVLLVAKPGEVVPVPPTAQALRGDVAATPEREL
jgi:hypothetical protein